MKRLACCVGFHWWCEHLTPEPPDPDEFTYTGEWDDFGGWYFTP